MDNTARLRAIFKDVELPEITGVDFGKLSHAEIAKLLPAYGGKHPMKAILIDNTTGKAYGIASGWEAEFVEHTGMQFKAGAVSPEGASRAGKSWEVLGNHMEAVAAAFMRNRGITDARLYINGRNPCWGASDGCYFKMGLFLAEGSKLSVYNKYGDDFISSWPDRKFHFQGDPD